MHAFCRERLWESAERVSRRGSVDGVAIIAKVNVTKGRHLFVFGAGMTEPYTALFSCSND